MSTLKPTQFLGRITWLGHVANRDASLASQSLTRLNVSFAGPEGDAHGGLTRRACSRVRAQYPEGTEIRNTRQISILSAEELAATAAEMGLAVLDPALVGASMVIEGIPDFSHVPPSSRLQGANGATVVVDLNNRPCVFPEKVIEARHPGFGKTFKPAANARRGITAWVEREGSFTLGEAIRLHVPDQRPCALSPRPARAEAKARRRNPPYSRKSLAKRLAMFCTTIARSAVPSPFLSARTSTLLPETFHLTSASVPVKA